MISTFLLWITFIYIFNPLIPVEASIRVMTTNQTLDSQTASFGPRISDYGLLAYIYEPIEDITGCQIVLSPEIEWIALLRRGGCSFYTKVQNMQKSGAVAVIIGDENNTDWITMSSEHDTSDIIIPSIFLTRMEYQDLLNAQHQINQSRRLLVLLQNEDTIPWSTMDCFYITMIICPMLLFILGWVFFRLRREYKASCLLYQRQELLSSHLYRMTDIDLELSLPKQYHHANITMDECPICLDTFHIGSEYRILPCHHTFHISCVDPWLLGYKSSCPVCNQELVKSNHPSICGRK
ncbi:uncharacterized protein BX664DRAFT_333988 [Halteromyces radiatus]|uniref:uncharacterized protein n=1 Tax=Halteromyces radiatus TaxID=101107 RepID=UPI00221E5867|nr:uncharacterized protein BX664DRAFT_333988 [Halteromyces radiatus]KAI8089819.1 hypothetical protein BX664DRAFT_333988 [Halteromyces radiatus]